MVSNIIPFKGREVDLSKRVHVYRCLNRKGRIFSVRQNGYVVGHTEEITLKDVKFVVNKAGKNKAIETMQRNVHAYIDGLITSNNSFEGITPITYNPFVHRKFHIIGQHKSLDVAPYLRIIKEGVFI